MSKSFEIKYYQNDAEDDNGYEDLPYPTSTMINFDFEFGNSVTWDVILWQFCKALEATGYEGVRNRIRVVDPYGIMASNHLFDCIAGDVDEDWGDWDDTEEDEEEGTDEEEEMNFNDIKKETA
jgi:hypothetical protein